VPGDFPVAFDAHGMTKKFHSEQWSVGEQQHEADLGLFGVEQPDMVDFDVHIGRPAKLLARSPGLGQRRDQVRTTFDSGLAHLVRATRAVDGLECGLDRVHSRVVIGGLELPENIPPDAFGTHPSGWRPERFSAGEEAWTPPVKLSRGVFTGSIPVKQAHSHQPHGWRVRAEKDRPRLSAPVRGVEVVDRHMCCRGPGVCNLAVVGLHHEQKIYVSKP
jgi:hypothetical protein